MRKAILLLGVILMSSAAPAVDSQSEEPELCQFNLTGEPAQPVVSGPPDVASRVRIVGQPDSPIQITAIDFEDSWVSLTPNSYTHKLCYKIKLLNRSDQQIPRAEFIARLVVGGMRGGTGSRITSPLSPNQESSIIKVCSGGGRGTPGADDYKLLVYIESVQINNCAYYPSLHLPGHLSNLSPPRAPQQP